MNYAEELVKVRYDKTRQATARMEPTIISEARRD